MAIAILKKRDAAALKALKQFLWNMSGPKAIETVLAQAVCGCAEASPETLAWILAQAKLLEPELTLERWARRRVALYLGQCNKAGEPAFRFEQDNHSQQWRLSLEGQKTGQLLRAGTSPGEWLLLNQLFEIALEM